MLNVNFNLFIGTCIVGGVLHFAAVSSTVLAQDSQGNPPSASLSTGSGVDSDDDVNPKSNVEASFETMTLRLAQTIISAAKEEAERQGWAMSFAIVNAAGHPVAMSRMDGARWITARVAVAKAFTAATFRRSSAAVEELAEQRPDLFRSVSELVREPMLLAGGGLPILIEGKLLGGLGASGGTEAEDIDCAQVGLDAVGAQ